MLIFLSSITFVFGQSLTFNPSGCFQVGDTVNISFNSIYQGSVQNWYLADFEIYDDFGNYYDDWQNDDNFYWVVPPFTGNYTISVYPNGPQGQSGSNFDVNIYKYSQPGVLF